MQPAVLVMLVHILRLRVIEAAMLVIVLADPVAAVAQVRLVVILAQIQMALEAPDQYHLYQVQVLLTQAEAAAAVIQIMAAPVAVEVVVLVLIQQMEQERLEQLILVPVVAVAVEAWHRVDKGLPVVPA